MKKIMMLATIAMLTVGCEKQPEAAQAQNPVKTEAVKAKLSNRQTD
jgi:PBP1b-binding outer membrane lipoprotein LpoB